MDVETMMATLKRAKHGAVLPEVTAADKGAALVVSDGGEWATGETITSTVSVANNKLVITAAE